MRKCKLSIPDFDNDISPPLVARPETRKRKHSKASNAPVSTDHNGHAHDDPIVPQWLFNETPPAPKQPRTATDAENHNTTPSTSNSNRGVKRPPPPAIDPHNHSQKKLIREPIKRPSANYAEDTLPSKFKKLNPILTTPNRPSILHKVVPMILTTLITLHV